MKPKIRIVDVARGNHIQDSTCVTFSRYDGDFSDAAKRDERYSTSCFTRVTPASARRAIRYILGEPIFGAQS